MKRIFYKMTAVKLWLGNLDTGLKRKEKTVTDIDFLRKAARAFRPLKVKKGSNQ